MEKFTKQEAIDLEFCVSQCISGQVDTLKMIEKYGRKEVVDGYKINISKFTLLLEKVRKM